MTLAVVHATVVTNLYAKGHRVTVSFKVCATSRRTSASRISGRSRSSSRTEDLGADGSREARQNSGQAAEPTGPNRNAGLEMIGGLTTALSLLFIAASVFGAAWAARWFVRQPPASTPTTWPDVSILKPLCGAEAQLSENIETYFHQDYPDKIQFVFGVQDPADRAIPVVKSLIERYPGLDIRLVVNAAAHGANRKVSNLINIGQVARYPVIVVNDSDVAVGPNYLRTLGAALGPPGAGAVPCLYRGRPIGGLWSRLSTMAVHDHFLPAVTLGLALGLARPCIGPTIAWSRQGRSRIR